MGRNRVKMTIAGTEYTVVSEEPALYMLQVGCDLDNDLREMMKNNPRLTPTMAAVLTAINDRDRLNKAEEAADNLRDQMREYLEENAALRAELERLRRRG